MSTGPNQVKHRRFGVAALHPILFFIMMLEAVGAVDGASGSCDEIKDALAAPFCGEIQFGVPLKLNGNLALDNVGQSNWVYDGPLIDRPPPTNKKEIYEIIHIYI